jgi:hypothetical protein
MKPTLRKTLICLLAIIGMFLVPLSMSAQHPGQAEKQDTLGYPLAEIKKGDRCLVCGVNLEEDGLAILYKGRRVPLANGAMLEAFIANPQVYFPKLQPKGALFQESAVPENPVRWGWFLFGVWVTLALLSGALSAGISLRKGLPPVKGFFAGLIGSVFGLLYIITRPAKEKVDLPPHLAKIRTTAHPGSCPKCGGQNHPSASKCVSCGTALTPSVESEVSRAENT